MNKQTDVLAIIRSRANRTDRNDELGHPIACIVCGYYIQKLSDSGEWLARLPGQMKGVHFFHTKRAAMLWAATGGIFGLEKVSA